VNLAGEGVIVTGADGRILLWNERAAEFLGYSAQETLGHRCWEVVNGYDGNGNRVCFPDCQLMRLIGMKEPVRPVNMRARRKDGEGVWLNVSTIGVPAGREGWVLVHTLRDATEATAPRREGGPDAISTAAPEPAKDTLSRRELEVLRLLAAGCNTRTAATRLHLAPDTVRNHVRNIFAKLGVHSRAAAVARATAERLM
jgi:PAS domain S-box-containing protein